MNVCPGKNRISVSIRLEIVIKTASQSSISVIKWILRHSVFKFCEFCPVSHSASSSRKSIVSQSGSNSNINFSNLPM